MSRSVIRALGAVAVLSATPLAAQEAAEVPATDDPYEGSVFEGNWLSIGAGAAYVPSYRGSDDYVVTPLPIVQGNLWGIGINPRPAGLALDFLPKQAGEVAFSAGIAAKLNRNRADQIEDPVVESYGELDTAIEVGPTVGVRFPGVLNKYDSLSFNVDALWDVAGAHNGMLVTPTVTYFTPVSRGAAVSLSLSATHVDDKYANYYYSVPAGGPLPGFTASGGFESAGANLLTAIDLDGNLANGGFAVVLIGGYSHLLGDARRSPFTADRGSASQWMGAVGVGYTF